MTRVLGVRQGRVLSKGFLDAYPAGYRPGGGAPALAPSTPVSGDKEGLFRAIVEPVVDQFKAMFREIQESFHQLDGETQKAEMGQYTARHQLDLLDYIYNHFDVFRLLPGWRTRHPIFLFSGRVGGH